MLKPLGLPESMTRCSAELPDLPDWPAAEPLTDAVPDPAALGEMFVST